MFRNRKIKLLPVALLALVLSASANSALLARLGGLAYYDDVSNLTWIADWSVIQGTSFDDDGTQNSNGSDGVVMWQTAKDWAASLTVGGVGGWRLPTADPNSSCNSNCTDSEMGNLFYNVLGNEAGNPNGVNSMAPFINVYGNYWSATTLPSSTDHAYYFLIGPAFQGYQSADFKLNGGYAVAVHDGDVASTAPPTPVNIATSGINFNISGSFSEHVGGGYPAITSADSQFTYSGVIDLSAPPLSTDISQGEAFYELPGYAALDFGVGELNFDTQGIWVTNGASEDLITLFSQGLINGRQFAIYVDYIYDPSVLDNADQISQWPDATPTSVEVWLWEQTLGTTTDIAEMQSALSSYSVENQVFNVPLIHPLGLAVLFLSFTSIRRFSKANY